MLKSWYPFWLTIVVWVFNVNTDFIFVYMVWEILVLSKLVKYLSVILVEIFYRTYIRVNVLERIFYSTRIEDFWRFCLHHVTDFPGSLHIYCTVPSSLSACGLMRLVWILIPRLAHPSLWLEMVSYLTREHFAYVYSSFKWQKHKES